MAKRLIVCCDGTWNFADQPSKTNVTKVALSVRPEADGVEQRVYYHGGVGTRRWERFRGGVFGVGLSSNIMDAYRFLVETYEPGDALYLFGFSRGAFTARSLAGLIRNCGILRREHSDRIKEAWALYRDRIAKPTSTASTLFRRTFAHETGIHFIGVWDTVGALGIPVPRSPLLKPLVNLINRRWAFHDPELSSWVKGAFHALAIDEQRTPFRPTLWRQQPEAAERGQELKQVWFAGVHSDVGGGYPETALSDIALLWMVDQARRYGLEFDNTAFDDSTTFNDSTAFDDTAPAKASASNVGSQVRADSLGMIHTSRKGIYLLSPRLHRPIGRGGAAPDDPPRLDGCEYVAETAQERHDRAAGYRPPELERYLAQGQVRLEAVPVVSVREPTGHHH